MKRSIDIAYPIRCSSMLCPMIIKDWSEDQIIELMNGYSLNVYCNALCFDTALHYPDIIINISQEYLEKMITGSVRQYAIKDLISKEDKLEFNNILTDYVNIKIDE